MSEIINIKARHRLWSDPACGEDDPKNWFNKPAVRYPYLEPLRFDKKAMLHDLIKLWRRTEQGEVDRTLTMELTKSVLATLVAKIMEDNVQHYLDRHLHGTVYLGIAKNIGKAFSHK